MTLRLFEIKEEPHEYLAESEGAANLVNGSKKEHAGPRNGCVSRRARP